jgi:hypothetical protein
LAIGGASTTTGEAGSPTPCPRTSPNYRIDPATVATGTGHDPYNLRYGYADNGNLTAVTHVRIGVSDTSTYAQTGPAGPHAVAAVTPTDSGGVTTGTVSYGYAVDEHDGCAMKVMAPQASGDSARGESAVAVANQVANLIKRGE